MVSGMFKFGERYGDVKQNMWLLFVSQRRCVGKGNVFAMGSSPRTSVKVRNSRDDLGAAVLCSVVSLSQPVGCALAGVVEVLMVWLVYEFGTGVGCVMLSSRFHSFTWVHYGRDVGKESCAVLCDRWMPAP